jgi:diguanylate cyclase (GGDEF)-like protein
MFDIDYFKKVNDTYGHVAGDEILVKIYRVIQKNLRSGDFIVRYGGEEFLALCEGVDYERARAAAERIRNEVEKRGFMTSKGIINITISVGVYTKEASYGDDIGLYVAKADEQLYKAKKAGRNLVR